MADKRSKSEVDYGPGMRKAHCGICAHFEAPSSCSLVAGEIAANFWCELFTRSPSGAQYAEALRK